MDQEHGAKAVAAQGRHWMELSSHAAKETKGWDRGGGKKRGKER